MVKLYGTLGLNMAGYDPAEGIQADLFEGARISDLLAHFNLNDPKGIVVINDKMGATQPISLPMAHGSVFFR